MNERAKLNISAEKVGIWIARRGSDGDALAARAGISGSRFYQIVAEVNRNGALSYHVAGLLARALAVDVEVLVPTVPAARQVDRGGLINPTPEGSTPEGGPPVSGG